MSKKIQSSVEMVEGHYHHLHDKYLQTRDRSERAILVKRLINLAGVIQFLISVQMVST